MQRQMEEMQKEINAFRKLQSILGCGEIRRIFRDGGAVKVGRSLKERSRQAMKIREEMALELQREPTVGELAQRLGIDVAAASELINVSLPTVSLTACDEEGKENQLDIPTDAPEAEITEKMALRTVVESLEEKDRQLIELRYFKGMTQVRTAKELGMSQVQVSRKEKAILLKMRKMM